MIHTAVPGRNTAGKPQVSSKASFITKLSVLLALLFCGQSSFAQNYNYTNESFEDATWPTSDPGSTPVTIVSSTGAWKVGKAFHTSLAHTGSFGLAETSTSFQLISPLFTNGASSVTFWAYENGGSNRTLTLTGSTDGGTTFAVAIGTTANISQNSWTQYSFTVTNGAVNMIKFVVGGGSGVSIDDVMINSAAPSLATVTTTAASNISFTTATAGGNVTNLGNDVVSDRGVVWSTTANPTVGSNLGITHDGSGLGAFTSSLTGLTTATTYHHRAFATNGQGTAYGADLTFTTLSPTPTITVTPTTLSFGNQQANTTSSPLSYSVSGIYLTPAAGNVTITAPAGYAVSTSSTSGFATSITIPYSGNALAATTIYVQFAPTTIGAYNGNITNAGGGAPTANVALTGAGAAALPNFTNVGFDFWTGFGYEENMKKAAGNSAEAKMSIYISVPSGATSAAVTVELPGIPGATGFPQTVTVLPGTVTEVTGFPTGDASSQLNPGGFPDTRLYYTGFSNRGVHIYSTNGVPISVWMHTYASNNSAAGAMLFPTNTWSSAYTVQAYGGYSNNSNPNSFFFVIAKEDNTQIWFTPSQDVLDSSAGTIFTDGHTAAQVLYHAGIEYGPFNLNKGQVFNAMGFIQGSGSGTGAGKAFGLDLSGSKVRTTCDKSIAVFGGNGRVLVNTASCTATTGSDNMIQQMFPDVAWGKKYLTVPTKTMEENVFRIYVNDPLTVVSVDGTPITGLINNLYYEIYSQTPQLITSDKPVSVSQLIIAAPGCDANYGIKGSGDPEMITLSPIEQSINNTTVYSAGMKHNVSASGHYINVIIKHAGVASFRLDGGTTGNPGVDQSLVTANTDPVYDYGVTQPLTALFQPHPQDTSYYYAVLRVDSLKAHTLTSDSTFNAIAYGMGSGESYGYNAGASLKDLSKFVLAGNPYGTTAAITCKNNPFFFKIALPYAPAQLTSLTWNFFNNPALTPNANVVQNLPLADSTFTSGGTPYYVYKLPTPYQFSAAGTYSFQVLANALTVGGCTGTKVLNNTITVVNDPIARINAVLPTCGGLTVNFSSLSTADSSAVSAWNWNFGDGATLADTSHLSNPSYTYPSGTTYTVSLRAINGIGCYGDTTKIIDLSGAIQSGFTVAPSSTVCAGGSLTFTSTSTSSGTYGSINQWIWNFGDATPVVTATTAAPQTHAFTTAGTYTVTLQVHTTNNCTSTVFSMTITVNPVPTVTSNPAVNVCSGVALNYLITGGVAGTTFSWSRAAVVGISNPAVSGQTSNPITEILINTTNAPIQVVYIISSTAGGCGGAPFTLTVTVNPTPFITSSPAGTVCSNVPQTYFISSNVAGATYTWDRPGVPGISNPPALGQTGNPITEALQNTTTAPVNVTYFISISANGCPGAPFVYVVTVNPTPTVTSAATGSICSGGTVNYAITGSMAGTTFSWSRAAVTGISNVAVSGQTSNPIIETLISTSNAPVAVTYVITPTANGCSGTPFNYVVTVNPTATISSAATGSVCSGVAQSYNITSNVTGATYSWSRAAVTGISNAAASGQTANPITETLTNTTNSAANVTYVITPSANGCAGTPFNYVVTVNPTPTVSFTYTPANTCATNVINFNGNATGSVSGYSWNFGDASAASTQQNPTHTFAAGGSYNVVLTATSTSGCTGTSPAQAVTVAPILTAPVVTNDPPAATSITFHWPAVTGAVSYEFSIDGGTTWTAVTGAGGLSQTVSGLQPNQLVTIQVRANGALACQASIGTGSATTIVPDVEIYVPNTFSPNGDGKNDDLRVYANYIQSGSMKVFNQWGQLVYSSNDVTTGWNGIYNGKAQPVGVYAYMVVVTLQNGKTVTQKGLVNLIR